MREPGRSRMRRANYSAMTRVANRTGLWLVLGTGGAQVDEPSLRMSTRQGFDRIAIAYAPIRTSTGGREIREFVRWIEPKRRNCALDAACGPATMARRLIGKV